MQYAIYAMIKEKSKLLINIGGRQSQLIAQLRQCQSI